MKGAIIGDIIGSAFKTRNHSDTDFQLFKTVSAFTDDTVLTLATADSVLNREDYEQTLKKWVRAFPKAGYRQGFLAWALTENSKPYLSHGDGAARRISPIGLAANSIDEALIEAEKSTVVTHNLPDRIRASKALAAALYMAKSDATKREIRLFIGQAFNYDLSRDTAYWKAKNLSPDWNEEPILPAFAAFFHASDYEEAIRMAITLGGPSNTIASIAGALAEAFFKHIPKSITRRALARLTPKMEALINEFEERYMLEGVTVKVR